jgi:2-polyprenyl-3-methyl-5-hydroxy-6-metoxy-1,4-benzoquinol methylase
MPEPWTADRAREFFDYEAQPKEWPGRCDACGSKQDTGEGEGLLAERDRYGFPVQTYRCVECELVFQWPRLAPAGLRALYAGPYRALVSAWHGREINAQTLGPEQREYGRKLGRMLGDDLDCFVEMDEDFDPKSILDLGGSTGVVATWVNWFVSAHQGPITIVEPSMAEAAVASRQNGVARVVVQSAEDFDPGGERYDLILLCQTVDHLRSISTVLRKVRTWLAPGGRFFVDAVDSSLIPEAERYKIDHVYALTPETMRAYLERAGFVAHEVPAPSANHVAYLCEVRP